MGAEDGSTVLTKFYDLSEIPIFIRAGAIIPSIPVVPGNTLGLAQQQYSNLVFTVHPGAVSGSTSVYEDDGYTMDYVTGGFVNTTASYTRTEDSLTFSVSSAGSYPAFPTTRTITLRIANAMPPTVVLANGAAIAFSRFGGANTWSYDGIELMTVIEVADVLTTQTLQISVGNLPTNDTLMSGVKGGIYHAILAKANLDITQDTPGAATVTGGALDIVSSTGEALAYLAGEDQATFASTIADFSSMYAAAIEEVRSMTTNTLTQYWSSSKEVSSVVCAERQTCLSFRFVFF
jgi:hypothetical protein